MSLTISIGKTSILIEVNFFYRFLSIDIGNRYSSMIDIGYYRLTSNYQLIDKLRLDHNIYKLFKYINR